MTAQRAENDGRRRIAGNASIGVWLLVLLLGMGRIAQGGTMQTDIHALPVEPHSEHAKTDWLVHPLTTRSGVYRSVDGKEIVLNNGLIRRAFRIVPNAACVAFDNLMTDTALLRAVKPEAILELNGTAYPSAD